MSAQEICAFCRQVRLLRNSHIIPEFLYRTLYDEKHRFKAYRSDRTPGVIREQKGMRERLLCDDCEQKFCKYEQFASDFFQGTLRAFEDTSQPTIRYGKALTFSRFTITASNAALTTSKTPNAIQAQGLDYVRLKLFLLSLLWRMGASKLDFFQQVELGRHQENLRELLLKNDPGEPDQYACRMWLIEADGRLVTDCQSNPRKFRFQGLTFYRLFTTGFRLEFCVSNQRLPGNLVTFYCIKRQPTYLWWVDSIYKHPDLAAEIIKVGRDLNWQEKPPPRLT